MYQINSNKWAIIHKFDTPKEVKIISLVDKLPNTKTVNIEYVIEYKNRRFTISHIDIYDNQLDADIFWSILIREEYEETLKYPQLFATDEFEIATNKANKILQNYADTHPDKLLKYF